MTLLQQHHPLSHPSSHPSSSGSSLLPSSAPSSSLLSSPSRFPQPCANMTKSANGMGSAVESPATRLAKFSFHAQLSGPSMGSTKRRLFCDEVVLVGSPPALLDDTVAIGKVQTKLQFTRSMPFHWSLQSSKDKTASLAIDVIPCEKIRRTMSETPVETGERCQLPCHLSTKDALKRISPATMIDLLDGKFAGLYDELFVVDCRYPYEYQGGRIPGAINVSTLDVIDELLFAQRRAEGSRRILVFHCEFSSERAPRMALHVRNLDRKLNAHHYPVLFYPEIYILDGGYKNFWTLHGVRCDPPHGYVPMRNPQFRDELRQYQRAKPGGKHQRKLRTISLSSRGRSFSVIEERLSFDRFLNC